MYSLFYFVNNKIGGRMKIRLGYACISKTLENVTSSSTYTYTSFKEEKDFQKLDKIIRSNFEDLEKILDYNIANNIHFFRISPKLIPLATHEKVPFDYITPYQNLYEEIGNKIRDHHMRIDLHPDQFCVLNSTREEVIDASFRILEYHYNLLNSFGIKNKVIILHVGGNAFGKEKSLSRFVNQFKKLPDEIQKSIAIENDDKIFNIEDCLKLHEKIGVPIILDYHHYICNNGNIELMNHFEHIMKTWKEKTPKIHFSSPKSKNKKDFRSHHDYIDVDRFIEFLEKIKVFEIDIDIMIEAKAKDEALFRLVRQLKYKTNYKFLDETTFLVS